MANWEALAVLPNLFGGKAVEGEVVALAPSHDPRVDAFCAEHPKFRTFLSRFTDPFKVPLEPLVFIVRTDTIPKFTDNNALMSFIDLVAMCVIPHSRSISIVHNATNRVAYSNFFVIYPWMFNTAHGHLTTVTPGQTGFHVVEDFYGQSSPELSVTELDDLDEPLFDALLLRWKRHYLGKRQIWADRALFRSLNMAFQAAQFPAGVGARLYDCGRIIALWVSAFEILAHPRTNKSGLRVVYPLFDRVSYINRDIGRRQYRAYMNQQKPWPRRDLACWVYGLLYQARNDFLHGNPITRRTVMPNGVHVNLFWVAPSLYRLALTGALNLSFPKNVPKSADAEKVGEYINLRMLFRAPQSIIERAILRVKKRANQANRRQAQ